jgi:hypothetical protein
MITFGVGLGLEVSSTNVLVDSLSINNYNVTIEKNEISKITSDAESYGILINEPSNVLRFENRSYNLLGLIANSYRESLGTNMLLTPTTQLYTITNNVIYNIASFGLEKPASRIGISLSPSPEPSKEMFVDMNKHRINKVLVANNTILLDDVVPFGLHEPMLCKGKAVAGIQVFDVNNYEIVNNAISIRIDRQLEYDYVSALSLRSQNPKLISQNVFVDNNAYYIDSILYGSVKGAHENASFVRLFELDRGGRLLGGGGFPREYNTLRNWYN